MIVKRINQQNNIGRVESNFTILHGIKGFVTPKKSFVKTGIVKIFCYNNKMFSFIRKTFLPQRNIAATKNLFVVPNSVAVKKKNIFSVSQGCAFVELGSSVLKISFLKTSLMFVSFDKDRKTFNYTYVEVSDKWVKM